MLDDLHDMLQKDPDAQVVANCMSVLLEVRQCKHSNSQSVTVRFHADAVPESKQMLNAFRKPLVNVLAQAIIMVMQTGAGQSLVTRALVISLLNRIKVYSAYPNLRC